MIVCWWTHLSSHFYHCHRCEQDNKNDQKENSDVCTSKRSFLKLTAASALSFGMMSAGIAKTNKNNPAEASIPPKPENVLTPDQALERLMRGNERYVSGKSKPLDFHDIQSSLT